MKKKLALLIALAIGSTCMAQSAFTNYPWMTPTPAGVYTLTEEMPMALWIDVINFNMEFAGGESGSAFKIDVLNGIGTNLAMSGMTVTDGLDVSDGLNVFSGGASVTGAVSVVGDVGVTGNITTSGTNTASTLIITSSISMPSSSVGSAEIVSNAVTSVKILNDAVITSKISDDAVTADKIADAVIFVPIGVVFNFASTNVPTGYLECNGDTFDSVANTQYAALYAVIGTAFGGTGANDFDIPDLRGEFVRGWDHGAGNDPNAATRTGGDSVGSTQNYQIGNHTHVDTLTCQGGEARYTSNADDYINTAASTTESRPRNIALMYCIKY